MTMTRIVPPPSTFPFTALIVYGKPSATMITGLSFRSCQKNNPAWLQVLEIKINY